MPVSSTISGRSVSFAVEVRAALISLCVSILLLVVKFTAYFLTGSNAIYSDALETVVNVLAASFAMYSIVLAHRPADKSHPYGHGKIEFFSAGLEGSMILLAAVLIVGKVAAAWLWHRPSATGDLGVGLILLAGALLLNGGFGYYLWFRGRRLEALTLEASGIHLMTDAIDSVIVLAAIWIVRLTGWHWVDNAAALVVAIYIGVTGLRLVRRSSGGLMDEQDVADQKLLRQILDAHLGPGGKSPRICSYHKLRHRHSGRYHWVDFHILVPAWWDVRTGHEAASAIEYEIELALREGNATAHVEPCAESNCANCQADGGERKLMTKFE
jgi:cation diffusion facilitator family transporter